MVAPSFWFGRRHTAGDDSLVFFKDTAATAAFEDNSDLRGDAMPYFPHV
jgi:hypothetical protein